jgi:anti-sigma factor RsiW
LTLVSASGFAQRAAVAHAVYSPDVRRPVEVDAAHEDQLVAWLSKRMGAPMKPPHLQSQGYTLEGGRLLPGGQGPVAQFMYRNELGSKLTLYVSNDVADLGSAAGPGGAAKPGAKNADTAFRFAQEGAVNVFYWVDGPFGYALSSDVDRSVLARVSTEVYQQLGTPR